MRLCTLNSYGLMLRHKGPAYWLEVMQRTGGPVQHMVDSGAFTVQHAGYTIDLDHYTQFCRYAYDQVPDLYGCIQLDVLRDHKASLRNLQYQHSHGAPVIPVLTVDAPVEHAHALREYGRVLCVAGGADSANARSIHNRLRKVHDLLGGDVALHALGYTRSCGEMRHARVSTVDSSSWAAGRRWGRFCSVHPGSGVMRTVGIGSLRKSPFDSWPPELQAAAIRSGLSAQDVHDNYRATRGASSWLACMGALSQAIYANAIARVGVTCFTAALFLNIQTFVLAFWLVRNGTLRWEDLLRAGSISASKWDATETAHWLLECARSYSEGRYVARQAL